MGNFDKKDYKVFKHPDTDDYGDEKYITEEMLVRSATNEEYLNKYCHYLDNLTDPVVKKILTPDSMVDVSRSFNIKESDAGEDKPYIMINDDVTTTKRVDFDPNDDDGYFNDESIIINEESTAHMGLTEIQTSSGLQELYCATKELYQETELVPTVIHHDDVIEVPVEKTVKDGSVVRDGYCHGAYGSMLQPNGHWMVGYYANTVPADVKKSPYSMRQKEYMKAVTFKATRTGYVSKVTVGVQTQNGTPAGEMVVEIVPLNSNGSPNRNKILGRCTKKFTSKNNTIQTFNFTNSPQVTKGTSYALIFSAPVCNRYTTYYLCGWRRDCYPTPSKNSVNYISAWGTQDGGKTWYKYLSNTKINGYSSYNQRPSAFAYEVYIQPTKIITTYEEREEEWDEEGFIEETFNYYHTDSPDTVLLNIPVQGAINYVQISAQSYLQDSTSIQFYISSDGRNFLTKTGDGTGIYNASTCPDFFTTVPRNLFVKLALNSTDKTKTPAVSDIEVRVDYDKPNEAYLRTIPYTPDQSHMLSADIWSNFDVDAVKDSDVDISIDLIRDTEETTETFTTLLPTLDSCLDYVKDYLKDDFSEDKFETDEDLVNYLQNTPEFLVYLQNWNIIILHPYNESDTEVNEFELTGIPSYPVTAGTQTLEDLTYSNCVSEEFIYTDSENTTYTKVQLQLPSYLKNRKHLISYISLVPALESSETKEVLLYCGELGNKLDSSEYYYDYSVSDEFITFDLTNKTYLSEYVVKDSENKITAFKNDLILNIHTTDTHYIERLDYTVDYENVPSKISWLENGLELTAGTISFTYNPVFYDNATLDDMEIDEDDDKTYTGIKLDFMSQQFSNCFSNSEYLNCYPVCPIRKVYYVDSDGYEDETRPLYEDVDYTVDYDTKMINFNLSEVGDVVVEYTPALFDSSLSLGVHMTRTDTDANCKVYNCSFSYRS